MGRFADVRRSAGASTGRERFDDTQRTFLDFWFEETSPAQWWAKSDVFDRLVETRFGALHAAAVRGELYAWRRRLRPMVGWPRSSSSTSSRETSFRDRPEAFAADGMALVLAQEAVAAGLDRVLDPGRRAFLYLPYMHSESAADPRLGGHAVRGRAWSATSTSNVRHQAIIERFGRYPHRNAILGRQSTARPNSSSSRRRGRPSRRDGKGATHGLSANALTFIVAVAARSRSPTRWRGSFARQGLRSVWSTSLSSIPVARWC
jgi:uncharacterized protein (DUF924 family)